MRQGSIILATALLTAAVTIFAMNAIGSAPTAGTVKASSSIDVMKLMREAKDLPNESYQAH